MKKHFLSVIIFVFLLLGFSSCKSKCYSCDFNGDVREICSKDLPDGRDGLKLTIDAYQDQGYKCTEK